MPCDVKFSGGIADLTSGKRLFCVLCTNMYGA